MYRKSDAFYDIGKFSNLGLFRFEAFASLNILKLYDTVFFFIEKRRDTDKRR